MDIYIYIIYILYSVQHIKYTHTYSQPYHPCPFNSLKTSKCINPEHKKGGSHKTKNTCNASPKLLLVKVPKDGAIALHCLRKRDLQDIGTHALDNLVVNKNQLPTCESSRHTVDCFRNPGNPPPLTLFSMKPLWKMGILSKWTCAGFLPSTHVFGTTRREIDPPKVLPCWIFLHSHFPLIGNWIDDVVKLWTLESNDTGHHFLDLPPPTCHWQRKGLVRDPRSPQTAIWDGKFSPAIGAD